MKKPRKTFQAVTGALLGFVALHLVRQYLCPPVGLDNPHGSWIFLGSFVTALGWVASGWGFKAVFKRLGSVDDFAESLAWVFAILFGFGFLRTHLGGIGSPFFWMDQIFWCVGLGLLGWNWDEIPKSKSLKKPAVFWALGILGLGFGLRALGALVLSPHGDPLYYHLLAPLRSFRAGQFGATSYYPYDLQAGPLEYVFGLAMQVLLSSDPNTGLIESHLASQVLHVFLGYLPVMALLFGFARQFFPKSEIAAALAAFVGTSAPEVIAFSSLAKNDWTAIFLSLLSWTLLRKGFAKRAFFFAGLAFSVKLTSLFFIFPFFAYELFVLGKKKAIRTVWPAVCFAVLAWAPVAIRNAWLSGNPFFPALLSIFPSTWASPTLLEVQSGYESLRLSVLQPQFWSGFANWVRPALHFFPAFLGYLFFATYFTRGGLKKSDRELLIWALICLGMLFLIRLKSQGIQLRLAGAILVTLAFISGIGLVKFISQLNLRGKNDWVAGLLVIAISSPPLYLVSQWLRGKHSDVNAKVLDMAYGRTKRWLRQDFKGLKGGRYRLGMVGESGNYYLSMMAPVHLLDSPELSEALQVLGKSRDPQEVCKGLRSRDIRQVFLNLPIEVIQQSEVFRPLLDPKIVSVVFNEESSPVVELDPRCGD
ncbi:MAG: hypothetical protein JNL01_03980 [Bdellovibrionales bacterium]|nr:hypothetical protein [Bdellovibrionales bacterium]